METTTNDIMDAAHTAHARANRLKEPANNIKALAFDRAIASSDQFDALLATLDAHAKGTDTEGSVL